jgi:hypothetical protein
VQAAPGWVQGGECRRVVDFAAEPTLVGLPGG